MPIQRLPFVHEVLSAVPFFGRSARFGQIIRQSPSQVCRCLCLSLSNTRIARVQFDEESRLRISNDLQVGRECYMVKFLELSAQIHALSRFHQAVLQRSQPTNPQTILQTILPLTLFF